MPKSVYLYISSIFLDLVVLQLWVWYQYNSLTQPALLTTGGLAKLDMEHVGEFTDNICHGSTVHLMVEAAHMFTTDIVCTMCLAPTDINQW